MHRYIAVAFMVALAWSAHGQTRESIIQSQSYPQGYFRSPLDIPHQASGTFGELRSTHFHAGDDYRTQQRVGLQLYAVAEGYISRLRVQAGGGGHSLYITHPNGYTSVYLHMDRFAPAYAERIKAEQYRLQRFDVNLELGPDEFPVRQGDRIGLAGNTGSSQGPHLHFEIRDTETQDPINPQLFGLHFPDKTPPLIQGITVYDLGTQVFNEHTPRRTFKPVSGGGSGQYRLDRSDPIRVNGRFGVGIQTIDRHDGSNFSMGVYSIELLLDGSPVSTVVFEKLSFSTSGSIHSYTDYPHFVRNRTRIQKSFKDPNNPINIFYHLQGDGSIDLSADMSGTTGVRNLTYRVRDVHGNTSVLSFPVVNDPSYQPERIRQAGTVWFRYGQENRYEADNLQIHLEENTLYDDLYFSYSQGSRPENGFSLMQHVHNNLTPLARSYHLRIRADESLPEHLQSKALIVNSRGSSVGGDYDEDGFVSTRTSSLGSFYVTVDTVPPVIRPQNISPGRNMAGQSRIRFQISDNLSGIASFNAYLNGEWVLMEYDPKNRALWHTLENNLRKGRHTFRLEVRDGKGNESIYEAHFTR